MSWCMTACNLAQYPKEDPCLEPLSDGKAALSDFNASDFGGGMLAGGLVSTALKQATGRAYGDVLPEELPQFLASANWAAVENAPYGALAKQFLELCVQHQLGVSMS